MYTRLIDMPKGFPPYYVTEDTLLEKPENIRQGNSVWVRLLEGGKMDFDGMIYKVQRLKGGYLKIID
jgi:hypothetical protein